MKTKSLLFLVLICALCVFSCSKDVENDNGLKEESSQVAFAKLNQSLAEYNASFITSHPSTRSFWTKIRGFLIADASGALIGSVFGTAGSVFCGILSSAFAGPAFAEIDRISINSTTTTIITCSEAVLTPFPTVHPVQTRSGGAITPPVVPPTEATTNSSIAYVNTSAKLQFAESNTGYLHNKIIGEIFTTQAGTLKGSIDIRIFAELVRQRAIENNLSISNDEAEQIVEILIAMYPSSTPSDGMAYYKEKNPELSMELSIVEMFIDNICNMSDASLTDYTKGFLGIVGNSDIPQYQINSISSAVTVAANSAVLWTGNN